jgi:hypothetical protein
MSSTLWLCIFVVSSLLRQYYCFPGQAKLIISFTIEVTVWVCLIHLSNVIDDSAGMEGYRVISWKLSAVENFPVLVLRIILGKILLE